MMMKQAEKSFSKFMLLWAGQFISAIGSGLTAFGLGVYVFQQSGSASAMALVTLCAFLPGLLLSVVAGVLADRYDRRLLMMLGDGLSCIGLFYILFRMLNGGAALWEICVGVCISSIFSSLLEPAYKATVSDVLTPEQYSKASGLVGIAGSAKYLISPILAGFLLMVSDIKVLLILDILTFFLTVVSTSIVKRGLSTNKVKQATSFTHEFMEGFRAVSKHKGVCILVLMGSLITLSLGVIQTLFAPLILAFSNSDTLGISESICASGMLVTSILIGCITIKKGYVKMLCISLFIAGISMAIFGLRENVMLICISGFLFFSMLPFANTAIDYLIRINIDNEQQGRAWGFIGVISQLGYVLAYIFSGMFADGMGTYFEIGVGRGSASLIAIAGILLSLTALLLFTIKSIRKLEKGDTPCIVE